MTVAAGLFALLTGIAYTGLGVITGYELIRHRRSRGFSHFGGAFLVMAFTCGPHHLVHAWRHLVAVEAAHAPMTASLLIGLAPGLIFVALRTEAAFGGRGDRLIAGTPIWIAALPCIVAAALGATLWESLRHAAALEVDLRSLIPNIFLGVNYLLVGFFTARTQLARRPVLGGWSLSGVAMSGVFVTCGAAHLIAGLLTEAHVWSADRPPAKTPECTSASPPPSTSCGRSTACTAAPCATGTAGRSSAARRPWAAAHPGP